MGIFNSIKKSRRVSSDIDEKIEYLNKELEKTGLREGMTTANVYVGGQRVDNPVYSSFTSSVFNARPMGHSPSDGSGGLGGAYTGKVIAGEHGLSVGIHDYILNLKGVANSPKHPVSGKRRYASTRTGMVDFSPTQPGVKQGNSDYPTGSVAWLWNPNQNNSDGTTGNWYPLEFDVSRGQWGFWDTGFLGFGFLNTNLNQLEFTSGDNTGSSVVSLFNTIGISNRENIGTEKTIVLQKNSLGDAGFLPINVGLSKQGYDYLKNRSRGSRGRRGSGLINYRQQKQKLDQTPTKSRQEIRGDKVKKLRSEGDNVGANIFYTKDRIKELEGKKTLTYREESELKGLEEYNDWISTFDTPENYVPIADQQKTFDTQAAEEKQSFDKEFSNNSNEIASNIATYIESTPNLSAEEKKVLTTISNDIRSGKTLDESLKNNIEPPSDSNTSTPPPPKPTPKIPEGVGSTTTEHKFPNGTSGTKIQTNDGKVTLFKNSDGEYVEANGKTTSQNNVINNLGKAGNTFNIGAAVATNSIVTHKPSPQEIEQFVTSLNGDMFENGKITVTGTELPYQDGNFKVTYDENGKRVFESNRDANGNQGANFSDNSIDAPTNTSVSLYGKPNLQVVFPPDGSEPYVLLEKYAYENKDAHDPNSPSYDPTEVPKDLSLGSNIAHFIGNIWENTLGKIPGLNNNKIPDNIKDMNIHGMAHTKEKIPFSDSRLSEEFKNQFEGNEDYEAWNDANNDKNAAEKYPPPGQSGEYTTPDGGKVKYYNKGLKTSADGSKYMEVLVLPWVEPKAGVHDGYYGSLYHPGSYTTKIPLGGAKTRLKGAGKEVYTPKPDPKPEPKPEPDDRKDYEKNRDRQRRLRRSSYEPKGNVLSEAAKLGHFEPEVLNVDINDIRKGIMPEFPKDPPPKMVDGYSEKSKLAPKKDEGDPDPFIKITKKDLAKNHMLKDSEIKKFMDEIDLINKYIKENPSELIYAQQRYPKDDPRLAQLNWQMDQMLDAGKEYMDKTFPENKKLFKKIQKSIKQNIELTDPKSFKDVEIPKYEGVNLTDFKRRKEVVARHYKKAVKIQKLFSNKKRRKNIMEEVESKKVNIQEIMTTSNMYFSGGGRVPNQDHIDFESKSFGGEGLGFSGADGNHLGDATLGVVSGVTGVALSPPHPVTGERISARHITTGLGDSTLLRPGVTIGRGFSDNPPQYTMGSVLWFYDSDFDNGAGQPAGKWCNLEYSNFDATAGQWFFWDTVKTGQFAGVYFANTDLSQHPCGDISGLIDGLNFPNGSLGPAETIVLNKNDLGDPDLLPIDIPGLSPYGFNYLFANANYDMYNWILKTYGIQAAEWYLKTGKTQGNPFAPYGSYFPRASNPYTGAQDGDMFAFFGGNKNNNKTPEKPTKKTRKGATDATAASTGMYPEMTPEIFQQKYGMSWQEYMNLP